jgi:hypothetical protein
MRRIGLSMLAVVIAVAAAVVLMRPPSGNSNIAAEASAMMPIAEMHAKIDPAKLPLQDFEDQALIFTAKQKE